jgi:hypothetical protein
VTPDGYINRTAGQNVPLYSNPDVVASAVAWGDRVEGSARGILAEAEAIKDKDESKAAALREAKDFLLELLTDGPLPTKEVQVAARNAGQSWRTIGRAKADLKISTGKKGDGWPWSLPQDQSCHEKTLSPQNPWQSWQTSRKSSKNKRFMSAKMSANTKYLAEIVGRVENQQNQEVKPSLPTLPTLPRCREGGANQPPDDTIEVEL